MAFEVPETLVGAYIWYLFLSTVPADVRQFVISTLGNPLCVAALLGVASYRLGTTYLRDQLPISTNFTSRMALLFPGRVVALYVERYGEDASIRILTKIRILSLTLFTTGMLLKS
jgi:hypothetical protein